MEKGHVTRDLAPFQKHQLRRLKPKQVIILQHILPYVRIERGKYELRLTYDIHPKSVDATEHGLTPMKLEQTILLDVRDK